MRKPKGWSRYLVERRLASGAIAYYWTPRPKDLAAGFTIRGEPLGQDYAEAKARADQLNLHLDAWRRGQGDVKSLDLSHRYGSIDWICEEYTRSKRFTRTSAGTQYDYRYFMKQVTEQKTKDGRRLGQLAVRSIDSPSVDKIYERLIGPTKRYRQANKTVSLMGQVWDHGRRYHASVVPMENPWLGVVRDGSTQEVTPATRDEAYALAAALKADGHPHLGAVPLIALEWLQRPENILAGHITWTDYRPRSRPTAVRIFHHKTGVEMWHALEDASGPLYPELEAYLADLPRLGVPIVCRDMRRVGVKLYAMSYAREIVSRVRTAAGLGPHVTMTACRHGGMTELGDAELTEQGIMSLSGHSSPSAARGYVKRTEMQRLVASRRRRAWIEGQSESKSRNAESK